MIEAIGRDIDMCSGRRVWKVERQLGTTPFRNLPVRRSPLRVGLAFVVGHAERSHT